MANGFAPYLLKQASELLRTPDLIPAYKITPIGFTNLLLESNASKVLSVAKSDSGHVRDVRVSHKKRAIAGSSSTTDSCSNAATSARYEYTIPALSYRQIAMHFSDDTVAQYTKEASDIVANPVSGGMFKGIMREVFEELLANLNGLLGDVNNDLLTDMSTQFGTNASGTSTINFPLDGTTNDYTEGLTGLMTDLMVNEIRPNNVAIVGGGIITGAMMQLQKGAIGLNQSGLNNSALGMPKFYYDLDSQSVWGTNHFGVFDLDSVGLVLYPRFTGFRAGEKGDSVFFNITLPIVDSLGMVIPINIDMQLKYYDCPTDIETRSYVSPYYETTGVETVARGWRLIASLNYALNVTNTNAFKTSDRLFGSNGTLDYVASNS